MQGWGTPSGVQPVYPGPFCSGDLSGSGVAGSTGGEGKLSAGDIQWLLTYVVPAVAGGLLLLLGWWWFATRRKRQLALLHRTVIEFPQPQLTIPAEQRQDAIIATPDENGWSNMKVNAPAVICSGEHALRAHLGASGRSVCVRDAVSL